MTTLEFRQVARTVTGLQQRLAAWADRTLLPGILTALLFIDAGAGFNWITASERSLASPAYDAAKMILPMHVHGLVMLLAALAAAGSYLHYGRSFVSGYLLGGLSGALWAMWAWLFTAGALGRPGASFLGTWLGVGLLVMHALVGLALCHRRTDPAPHDGT